MSDLIFKPLVYIETTIPSLYHNYRTEAQMVARQEWTREWWDFYSSRYELVTSAYVLTELSRGEYPRQTECLELIEDIPLLNETEQIKELARTYIKRFVMPEVPSLDAFHLATASLHQCHIILTWNCVHLANARKSAHISAVNKDVGLPAPRLATPYELLAENENT